MLPPQGDADVRPVETALRQLDDRLRIVWNPQAYLICPGSFDATGKNIPARYDGRWQVIILNGDPQPPVVYTLAEEGAGRKAYRPVGDWLVPFMQRWDAQNVHRAQALASMYAAEDEARHSALVSHREAVLAAVDEHAFQWSGRELFPGFTPNEP